MENNIVYRTSLITKPNVAYKSSKGRREVDGDVASVSEESFMHNGIEATAIRNDSPEYDYIY